MIWLPQEFIDEMIAQARAEAPYECGGLIASLDGRAVKLYKVESSPKSTMTYAASSADNYRVLREVEDNGWVTLAVYHSHPHSQAYPSPTDVEVARAWFDSCHHIIVSPRFADSPVVRAFRIADGEITEDELRLSHRLVDLGPARGLGEETR